ncbi:MAG TPA: hypothetical protein VMT64_17335 [Candidatus Binataceae bacterium]|nr:hypothetical protein [Candidatus Binataceae bacterium]
MLGFIGILALASVGAADGHKGKTHSHHGDAHPWGGDGGDGTFGLGDFKGIYVDSFQGNVGGGVWVIGNGLLTSDGAGNVTGNIVINDSAGNFCPRQHQRNLYGQWRRHRRLERQLYAGGHRHGRHLQCALRDGCDRDRL